MKIYNIQNNFVDSTKQKTTKNRGVNFRYSNSHHKINII